MRTISMVLLLLVVPGLAAFGAEADERLAALGWLEGDWRMETERGVWEARYTGSAGGVILSTNKSLAGDRLRSWEYELFVVRDGQVIMQPYPNGEQSPVVFTLTTFDAAKRLAVFENPEHDFPQILTYQRVDEATLNIKVQARRDGKLGGFELNLKRVD